MSNNLREIYAPGESSVAIAAREARRLAEIAASQTDADAQAVETARVDVEANAAGVAAAVASIGPSGIASQTLVTATGGTTARTLAARAADVINAIDYGAFAELPNVQSQMQDAIARAGGTTSSQAQGNTVLLPAGAYYVPGGLAFLAPGVRLKGSGSRATTLVLNAGDGAAVRIAAASCQVKGIRIVYIGQGVAGDIGIQNTSLYGRYNDVWVQNAYTVAKLSGGANQHVFSGFVGADYTRSGLEVDGANNVNLSDFFFLCGSATQGTQGGICLRNQAEGIIANNGQVYGGARPITTDATVNGMGSRPAYSKFSQVYFDSAANPAQIKRVAEFDFTSCWFSNRPEDGAEVSESDGVRFTGGGAVNCDKRGVYVRSTSTGVRFDNFAARGNSAASSGTYAGIELESGTSEWSVANSPLGGTLGFGTQRCGLLINALCDNYSVIGNNVSGSGGGISDLTSGIANKVLYGNIGYRTSNRGLGLLPSGTSSVTFAHGLAATPSVQDVLITPLVDPTVAGVTSYWVSAATSTTITLTVNATSINDFYFSYDARVGRA